MKYFLLLILLGGVIFSCSSENDEKNCTPNAKTICREGVTYWVDSCGNEGNVAGNCDCGCNADFSACKDPCECTPDCNGKECGSNGCGGTCDPGCSGDDICNEGQCEACVPDCTGKCCGDDECSGTCSDSCANTDQTCNTQTCLCEGDCIPLDCGHLDHECGVWPNGCGQNVDCGNCTGQGEVCFDGSCCIPDCQENVCGTDGCGGTCGECEGEEICDSGICRSGGQCESKLTAIDAQAGDFFGSAVSISEDVAIVGAYGDDEGGSNAGAAYIFKHEGSDWKQKKKLIASDPQAEDEFGVSVSISGDVAIVGARREDGGAGDQIQRAGAAYIFQMKDGEWTLKKKLIASDPQVEDFFGHSVSISGNVAIVGAPYEDSSGGDAGAAYVFQLVNSEWLQKQKLTASDAQGGDGFGLSVSISGEWSIVGAYSENGGDGDLISGAGAAYIFRLENGAWVEKQKVSASDAQAEDYFGCSVSISGDVAIVGSNYEDGDDVDPYANYGAAYLFQLENGQWEEKQKLTASDAQKDDYFGFSVSISGDVAIVGAPFEDGGGTAYFFQFVNGVWGQKEKLIAPDAQEQDNSGYSVATSGNSAIVGAPEEDGGDGDPMSKAGAAYLYTVSP